MPSIFEGGCLNVFASIIYYRRFTFIRPTSKNGQSLTGPDRPYDYTSFRKPNPKTSPPISLFSLTLPPHLSPLGSPPASASTRPPAPHLLVASSAPPLLVSLLIYSSSAGNRRRHMHGRRPQGAAAACVDDSHGDMRRLRSRRVIAVAESCDGAREEGGHWERRWRGRAAARPLDGLHGPG